jgi:RNA polymerase sigma factor (sigma-70 family)
MASVSALSGLVLRLRRECGDGPADGDLLAEFAVHRYESAFAELVCRHGKLVLGVARRHLPDRQAAEDVFQATFVALSRNASRLGRPPSLVNWLYTVALRQARKTRLQFSRRTALLSRVPIPSGPADPLAEVSGRELVTIVDDELSRLPVMYRLPLLLCAIEGLSREEAARRLGWPVGSVKGRLERGRELLRKRLAKRGLTVPAVLAGGLATPSEALPATMVAAVTRAAVAVPVAGVSTRVALSAVLLIIGLGVGAGAVLIPAGQSAAPKQPPAVAAAEPRDDLLGDALPDGAVARLGSLRLRPGERIYSLAFSPDGRRIAAWSNETSERGRLSFWDTSNGRGVRRVDLPRMKLLALRWLADGHGIAVLDLGGGEFFIWDFADETTSPPPARPRGPFVPDVRAAAISPDGRWLAIGHAAQTNELRPIELREVVINRPLSELKARTLGQQPGHGYKLAFSSDSRTVYALSRTQEPDQPAPPAQGGWNTMRPGKWADQARLVAYDVVSGQEQSAFDIAAPQGGGGMAFIGGEAETFIVTPDGRSWVTGHEEGTIRVWDATTGRERRSWVAHRDAEHAAGLGVSGVRALAISPDGRMLITAGIVGGSRIWDWSTGTELHSAVDRRSVVNAVAVSADGKTLASGGSSGSIRLRDVATGADRLTLPGHTGWIERVHIFPDGRTALTSAGDGTLCDWDLSTGRESRRTALDGPANIWPTAFTEDGRQLLGRNCWGNPGKPVAYDKFLWDADTGQRQPPPQAIADSRLWILTGPVHGTLVALDLADQSVSLHDWPSGQVRQTFPRPDVLPPGNTYRVEAATLSADGKVVAVVGWDNSLFRVGDARYGHWGVYDAATGRLRRYRPTPDAGYTHVTAIPDGSGFVTGGRTMVPPTPVGTPRAAYQPDQALVMFDATTVNLVRSFLPSKLAPDGNRAITALAVSPDGRQLAAAESDHSIWVYEVVTGQIRRHLPGHTNEVTALAFTPDGRRLVSTSRDLTGLVWDVSLAAGRGGPLPTAADAERVWANLASSEWDVAGPALATFAAHPDGIALLREQLKQATGADGADPAALAALIKQLDSDGFAERERATAALRRHGSDALPAVRERLSQSASAELRQRLTRLIEDIRAFPTAAERLRELRLVELLEQTGTPAAREHLKSLAGGAAGATLTRAAADSLKRLPK